MKLNSDAAHIPLSLPAAIRYNNGKEVSELPDRGKAEAKPHHPHDKGYRQLLANKKTFLELLQTFVREGWVWEIEESDLTLVEKSYVLQDFSGKEADIVYKLRLREIAVHRGSHNALPVAAVHGRVVAGRLQ